MKEIFSGFKIPAKVCSMWEWAFLSCILILSSLLLLLNLNNHYLWQDEAQTALLAKTVMDRAAPYGTDGINFFSQELGAEYGENYIWRWHTWFPFYLVAGFFKLFGTSTFVARLPFALFGIATVVLLYFFTDELWHDKHASVMAVILILLCVPFLLLSRQCRYYSPSAFFSLLGLFAYIRILDRRKFAIPLSIFAGTLLFHTHFIYTASLLAGMALHCLLFSRKAWRQVVVACSGVLLLSIPWIVWLSGMRYGEVYEGSMFRLDTFISKAATFGLQTAEHIFPMFFLLVPAAVVLFAWFQKQKIRWKNRELWNAIAIPITFTLTTLIALSCTSPGPFLRYLCPIIPPMLAIAGILLAITVKLHWLGGALLIILTIVHHPIMDFMGELRNDYDGPIEGLVKFLKINAKSTDVVAITYGDMPLKFYTDLRIVGGLTGEDLSASRTARWVIIRRNIISQKDYAVRQYLIQHLDPQRYRRIVIDYPDLPFENRESPDEHRFKTAVSVPPVEIYERMELKNP